MLLCAIAVYFAWLKQGGAVDDALIPARYARHLLDGHGWTFNVGETVNGSTSALNTLLTATLGLLFGIEAAQVLIFGICSGSTAWLLSKACTQDRRPNHALAAAVMTLPYLWWFVGLETAVALLLIVATLISYARYRYLWAGALAALAFLARGDCALLLPILGAHWAWTRRGDFASAHRALWSAAAVLIPWFVYSASTFGSVFPGTLAAKRAHVSSGLVPRWTYLEGTWLELVKFCSIRCADALGALAKLWGGTASASAIRWLAWALVLGFVLAACKAWLRWLRRDLVLAGLLVFALAQWLAYVLLAVPLHHWYYAALMCALSLGVLFTASDLWQRTRFRWVGLALALSWLFVAAPSPWPDRVPQLHYSSKSRYGDYRAAAAWLREHASPSTLACKEVGVLGWELREWRVRDMLGLVTPGGAKAIARGRRDWWIDVEPRPEWILVSPGLTGIDGSITKRQDIWPKLELAWSNERLMLLRFRTKKK